MRKKMALSVLVIALAMLLSFGATFDQAQADSILFPWIVKSNAISTIVSVVNTAGVPLPFLNIPELHVSYFYKDPDNNQTTTCQDYDFKVPTSQMDICSWDAAGNINGGVPMWGDPNNGVLSMALLAPGDRRAFLIVDNNTPDLTFFGTNLDGTLYGEAMVVELATGAAWGYQAYNSGGPFGNNGVDNPLVPPYPDGQNGFVSFTNGLEVWGDVIGRLWFWGVVPPPALNTAPTVFIGGELAPITLMPRNDITTTFFMTPTDMISAAFAYAPAPWLGAQSQYANTGQRNGNINTNVGVCAIPEVVGGILTGNCLLPGIHKNDEAPISSTKLKNIVCTSADDISALLDAATVVAWDTSGSQAWTYMRTAMGNLLPAPQYQYSPNMMIGKLEWVDGGSTIDGTPVAGTYNNFIQTRNNMWNFIFAPLPFADNNLIPVP
jgi:hypothetical protein